MFGLLAPSNNGRSRSKSPSGRERDSSRSRPQTQEITRAKSPSGREDTRRSSHRKRSDTESDSSTDSDDGRRRSSKKSSSGGGSKKYYDEDSHDERRKSKSSGGRKTDIREPERTKIETREPERSRKSVAEVRSPTSKDSRGDPRMTAAAAAGITATAAAAASRSGRGRGRGRSSSESSSDSDDIPERRPKLESTSKADSYRDDRKTSGYTATPYPYPSQPDYFPEYSSHTRPPPPGGYRQDSRQSSYTKSEHQADPRQPDYAMADPRYATPGSFHPPNVMSPQRGASFSGPTYGGPPSKYAEVNQFQYAQPPSDVTYKYGNGPPPKDRQREYPSAPDHRRASSYIPGHDPMADGIHSIPLDPRYAPAADKKYAVAPDAKYAPPSDLKYTNSHESRVPGFFDPAPVEFERVRDSQPPGGSKKSDKKYRDEKSDRKERRKHDSSSSSDSDSDDGYKKRDAEIKTVVPKSERSKHDEPSSKSGSKEKRYHDDKYTSRAPAPAPDPPRKMSTMLSVDGGHGAHRGSVSGAAKPPASPLLEAYKGTYQSISPMPSALVLYKHDSDLSDLDLDSDLDLGSKNPKADLKKQIRKLEKEQSRYGDPRRSKDSVEDPRRSKEAHDLYGEVEVRAPKSKGGEREVLRSRHSSTTEIPQVYRTKSHIDEDGVMTVVPRGAKPEKGTTFITSTGAITDSASVISSATGKKTVLFYDASSDAQKIAIALKGTTRAPNVKPLIQILPGLSTDDLLALRAEYKTHAQINGQGINIAKHIKMRVPGNLGKVTYATALGRWESEAFWANSWYQGGASRRELLIESLMGRSNSDIREIKNCFKDKRYGDDLVKCMKAELKADKFRTAILLALEEKRMPESLPLDLRTVKHDVEDLHRSLRAPGGETAMIEIIVVRSDRHLMEVMRMFEVTYEVNFAKEMISKSRNLVGETLAHVINGALNRPMRDALLLHQAIAETAPGKERAELLISRLVRMHWEPKHLEKVKEQYYKRYGSSVVNDIRKEIVAPIKVEENRYWAEFCVELVKSSE